ncbi:MAG: hypothetical protein QF368_04390, partial [SAR202 cluster bacterium]|nr:hypothetical protein [SAR202 cluster bacterium]
TQPDSESYRFANIQPDPDTHTVCPPNANPDIDCDAISNAHSDTYAHSGTATHINAKPDTDASSAPAVRCR